MAEPLTQLTLADVPIARQRIQPYVQPTPLVQAHGLSRRIGSDIWLKCDLTFAPRNHNKYNGEKDRKTRMNTGFLV